MSYWQLGSANAECYATWHVRRFYSILNVGGLGIWSGFGLASSWCHVKQKSWLAELQFWVKRFILCSVVVACTKCETDADESDAVCLVCGGFLAGKARPGLGTDSSGAPIELFSVNVDSRNVRATEPDHEPVIAQAPIWPILRQALTLLLYAVFVIGVAVVVNWMLRRL